MKTRFPARMVCWVLAGVGVATASFAQLLPKSSITLDAKSISSGGGKVTGSSYYYRHRSYESAFLIEATLRNLGREPVKCEVEWFFTAKPMSGGRAFVFDKGSKEVEVPAAREHDEVIESATVSGSRSDYWYGRYESGAKKDGWIIRVKENGVVTRVKASTPSLETIAKDQAQLDALLKRPERR